ncbi:MAG: hypothetical protein N2747_06910 [Chitinophagaceae bacterium]|nr:hypothetical protein [Chitinophagaceae bacterium]
METYKALALQTRCEAVNSCRSRSESMALIRKSVSRIREQILAAKQFIGHDLRLVVLPEYFLTGYPLQETLEEWKEKAALEPDDEIYQSLSEISRQADIYLSGNLYEKDSCFPDLYFQVSFILSPEGETILRYRRLISLFTPTPHDVLQEYIKCYGEDSLFPVAETPIGCLACIASEEILYPEIARSLALKGAEIFCHNTSEAAQAILSPKNIAKLARALENMAYVVSANSAGIFNTSLPAHSADGHSQIVHYEGYKLAEALTGESMVAHAFIHLNALRSYRQRPGMNHFLSRLRNELFLPTYQQTIQPPNQLLTVKPERNYFITQQKNTIQWLLEKNILKK